MQNGITHNEKNRGTLKDKHLIMCSQDAHVTIWEQYRPVNMEGGCRVVVNESIDLLCSFASCNSI